MKLTETKLRSIVRSVLKEGVGITESPSVGNLLQELAEAVVEEMEVENADVDIDVLGPELVNALKDVIEEFVANNSDYEGLEDHFASARKDLNRV